MKISVLCLAAALASTANAFVVPRPSAAAATTLASSSTQLGVAAEIVNTETKPRRTRKVRSHD